MKVASTKRFKKQLSNCPSDIVKRFVVVYDKMEQAKNLGEISSVEKLTGFDTYYRIRIGDFRLGFEYVANQIELLAIMDRKEIYRYFP
jgi:mRNA interferase RelE/StbE